MNSADISTTTLVKRKTLFVKYNWPAIKRDFRLNYMLMIMILPILVYFAIFHYGPMYGLQIAFRDYRPRQGITGSQWVGLKHFMSFFKGVYFGRLMRNTLLISLYTLIFSFPAPILLALMLNEIGHSAYKRTIQTLTYLPYFVSMVVIAGLITNFTRRNGLINDIVELFGGTRRIMLQEAGLFRTIYVVSDIWQGVGWGSIIYLAAISAIDQELYEAAKIDGAGRFGQMFHVTLPGIAPTIIIMLILRIGRMMNVGYEKIMLLYNTTTYETADVISTYVYRRGMIDADYSFSSAVGLFNSVINFVLIISANKISDLVSGTSLW
jgi:putative aldouronate transport system permease protein